MEKIIRYALDRQTRQPAYINDVKKGLACDCVCELCGNALIAAQGEKNTWHFKHAPDSDCPGSQETAIHKLAKLIICNNNHIHFSKGELQYSNPRPEEKFLTIRPDIIVLSDTRDVFIEILVTHPIDHETEKLYVNGKHRSIEIDLQDLAYDITPDELTEILINDVARKRIVYWDEPILARKEKENASKPFVVIAVLLAVGYLFRGLIFPKSKRRRIK